MNTKEKIEVMQAFEDGEEVEIEMDSNWCDMTIDPTWNWGKTNYRVKPKEKTKLYKYAYKNNVHERWDETGNYYKNDNDFKETFDLTKQFIRLDHTMIEVD